MRPDLIDQVKAHGTAGVARAFGFTVSPDPGRPPRWVSPCPACGEATRHHKTKDRRGAVGLTRDAAGWRCFQCDASGDAFGFAAWAELKRAPRRGDARAVLEVCAGLGLCDDPTGKAAARGVVRRMPSPPPVEAPRLERPPAGELAALWRCAQPLAEVSSRDPARAYLEARGFAPDRLAWAGDMVRVLSTDAGPPGWWPAPWCSTWPVVFPAYDALGRMVSIHARAVSKMAEPKTRWPKGYAAGGLLFADETARTFLQAGGDVAAIAGLEAVVIAEGATDTLKLAQVLEGSPVTWGVLGYTSGSGPALEHIAWPSTLPCLVAVDDDDAGDAYAVEVRRALRGVPMFRVRPPSKRHDGRKGADWADLADELAREILADVARWEVLRD